MTVGAPAREANLAPYGDKSQVAYADPGYQSDKVARYPIDNAKHAKAAYAYISQQKNAAKYTSAQLKRIKGRIKAALGKFGVTVAAEGWSIDAPLLLTEAVAEYAGMDPECAGSYSLSATNGPTTVTVCSWGLDPADLQQILAQACAGAGMALKALDPDMDADVDVTDPGESAPDDGDATDALATRIAAAVRGESAEDPAAILAEAMAAAPAVTETAPEEDTAPEPAADREGTEGAPMSDATTTETVAPATAAAPAIPQDVLDAAVGKALAARKAAKKAARAKTAESAPAATAPETAAPSAPAEADLARMVNERVAAALAEQGLTETTEQKVARLVAEQVTEAKQAIVAAGGGPARKGLVAESGSSGPDGGLPENFPMRNGAIIPMEEWTDDNRRAVGGQLEAYVLGSRAS